MASGFQLPKYYRSPSSGDPNMEAVRNSMVSTLAPRVPWDVFLRDHFVWNTAEEGEHIALIGPTGQGKTVLSRNLAVLQPFVSVFGTKPRDNNLLHYIDQLGYVRMSHWRNGLDPLQFPKRVIWPDVKKLGKMEDVQRAVFEDALQGIYLEGNWTVILDEYWYMINVLKMERALTMFLTQARSLGISMIMAMQRPRDVPVASYSQSTHLFFWRMNDAYEVARLAEIGGGEAGVIRDIVKNLERYQVLYVNTRTGAMVRTKAPAPD